MKMERVKKKKDGIEEVNGEGKQEDGEDSELDEAYKTQVR